MNNSLSLPMYSCAEGIVLATYSFSLLYQIFFSSATTKIPGLVAAGLEKHKSSSMFETQNHPTSFMAVLNAALAIWCVAFMLIVASGAAAASPEHLVVLSHGLHGSRFDLTYLAEGLEESGCMVTISKANEYLESHHGVREGGSRLAAEVRIVQSNNPALRYVSFVGNSLGGLYSRYAIKELYDAKTGLVANLRPRKFMVRCKIPGCDARCDPAFSFL
jgi:hypothetical protein